MKNSLLAIATSVILITMTTSVSAETCIDSADGTMTICYDGNGTTLRPGPNYNDLFMPK